MANLGRVGHWIGEALGDGPRDGLRLARQQAIVREALARRAVQVRWLVFGSLTAAVGVLLLLVWPLAQNPAATPVSCHDERGKALREGDAIRAPGELAASLRFSDGSSVVVERRSRVRLRRLTERLVRVTLESGSLRSVVHRKPESRWRFDAGPYEIHVTGTALSIAWDATKELLEVAVQKGSVRVGRAGSAGRVFHVGANERLTADHRRGQISLIRPPQLGASPITQPSTTPEVPALPEANGSAAAAESNRRRPRPLEARRRWLRLARAGNTRGALAEVRRIGFRNLLARLSARDLIELADVARLGGELSWAQESLLRVRERFPEGEPARLAAFRLGRLAFDYRHDHRAAARWFEQFLAEAPAHVLASDARGRLMVACLRIGKLEQARALAREYLERHPRGPYGASARALLSAGP